MKALIVLAHPEPTSFNAALAARGVAALRAAGHEVTISDLVAQGFDPRAGRHDFTGAADAARFSYQNEQAHAVRSGGFSDEIAREQERVADADLLVFQFPLWWGGVPAVLKGWIERVMAYGFAYADGLRYEKGVFRGRRAMVSMTTGGLLQRFGRGAAYGELEDQVLWQVQHLVLEYMGYTLERPFVAYGASRVDAAGRAAYLDEFADRLLEAAARPVDRRQGIEDPLSLVPDSAISANR
jgi:NAD(P)H dehydrogenase (quinone)